MSLKVDTAGSSGAEVELAALKVQDAKALKAVYPRSERVFAETSAKADERDGEQLIALSWGRLFKVGLTQNHLRNAMTLWFDCRLAEPLEGCFRIGSRMRLCTRGFC